VYLWRYLENVQNYPGWNVAADRAGTETLREVLALVADGVVPTNEISCTQPSQIVLSVPNNGESPVLAARVLRLEGCSDSSMPAMREIDGIATFSMSPAIAKRLALSLDDPPSIFDTALLDDPVVWYWGVVPGVG
jgi:hypothetical protein